PAAIALEELRLFDSAPESVLLLEGVGGELPVGMLQATAPRYRADVVVRADIDGAVMRQSVSINCQPEISAVGSIVVRLAPRPRGEVRWHLRGDELRELPALVENQLAAAADEAVYRLLLPRARSSGFEVIGN